jgi:hypothetical protein
MDQNPNIRSAADQARVAPEPTPHRYEAPNLSQSSSNTPIYIAIAAVCGVLAVCGGLVGIIVVCLAAIQIIGKNANSAFGTVGASIGATVTAGTIAGPRERQSEQAARAYLDDIDANRLDSAFRRTSKGMQQLTTADDFKNSLKTWPGLLKQRFYTINRQPGLDLDPNMMTFVAHVRGEGNWEHRVTLEMVSEQGDWKVDTMNVENLKEGRE